MPSAPTIAASLCVLSMCLAGPARAQDYVQSSHAYFLHPPSSYQQGCWGPCACLLSNREAMLGSFTLNLANIGDATDFYTITNVNWRVPQLMGQNVNMVLNGSGSFAAGQSPFATHQHMSLSLSLSPAPAPWNGVQEFDTTLAYGQRTVAPPVIDMEVANSTTGCPGVRMRLVATWYKSDADASGVLSVADIFTFLNSWFAGDPAADFDDSGALAVADVHLFLNTWFAGL